MIELADVQMSCYSLDELFEADSANIDGHIRKHLDLIESKLNFTIPDFPDGLEWLNTSAPISLTGNLQGKIVVLDFFTYCCVNCMHILPDLETLEEKYPVKDGVSIIGVHSAKFENEKVSANILSAVLRYNIHHPVVNDSNQYMWNQLQIACWPTLVIVGPSGQLLYQIVGEGHRDRLLQFMGVVVEYYKEKGQLLNHELPVMFETPPESSLSFPGKVCVSEDGNKVAIADTGHHRVLMVNNKGIVQHTIGSGERGFKDGTFREAEFSSPQGLALLGNCLYIADTNNHAIRKADLGTQTVVTIAGTGCQGNDKEGGKQGLEQELASPWDLCITDGLGAGEENALLMIAMAGTHQIWTYFIKDSTWLKNSSMSAGRCVKFTGSGIEENKNNSYPDKAGFAQPSGLAASKQNGCLFVADSESSSIRRVQLKDGAVKNVVGGDIDPRNLFAYGDVDGVGTQAKLQHPLGVAMATDDGPLFVADSYNHKIKKIDITKRSCETVMGSGSPGNGKGDNLLQRELNEPGGICCDRQNKRLYIADTNNSDVKVLELDTDSVYSLPVIFSGDSESVTHLDDQDRGSSAIQMSDSSGVPVRLVFQLPEGTHLNEEAPSTWTLTAKDDSSMRHLDSDGVKLGGGVTKELNQHLTFLSDSTGIRDDPHVEFELKLDLILCKDSGMCMMEKKHLHVEVEKPSEIVFTLDPSFSL